MNARQPLVAALLLLTVSCQQAGPVADTAADEATVLQFVEDFAAAEASNDDDAVMEFWWEDGVMQPPNAPTIVGAEGIRALYETITFESLEVGDLSAKVSGDLAVVWGPLSYDITVEGLEGLISDQGKFVVVLERRSGIWKGIENTWNSDLPPASPPTSSD